MGSISHFFQIIDLFCWYLETARVSQFIQPITYNAGQQPFLAMTSGLNVGNQQILVRLTHSLILFHCTRHQTKKLSSLLSKPSLTRTCWPVTFQWPSTNSTRLLRRLYCCNQWRNSSSLAGQTSEFSASTPTGHSSKGSTNAESPSQSRKDVFCSGNVWLFQLHCGPKFSNSFTKDN